MEHPWYDPDDPRHEEPTWQEEQYYEDMGMGAVGSSGLSGIPAVLSNRVEPGAERHEAHGACCSAPSQGTRAAAPESTDGLSRASGVCPSFGRILAAPLAGASLARETKEAA